MKAAHGFASVLRGSATGVAFVLIIVPIVIVVVAAY